MIPRVPDPPGQVPGRKYLCSLPCPSFPCFLGKRQGKPPKKQGFFIPTEPLKSLEKKGKTLEKTRKSSKKRRKIKEIQKNKERKDRVGIPHTAHKLWALATGRETPGHGRETPPPHRETPPPPGQSPETFVYVYVLDIFETPVTVTPQQEIRKRQFVHKIFVHNFCAPWPPPPPSQTSKVTDFLLNFY